jgi:hypothetical protein
MPFWNLFWLIVPGVALLTTGVVLFVRNGSKSTRKAPRGSSEGGPR